MTMCNINDTLNVIDSAEGVVHMTYTYETCARGDETLELREDKVTVLVGRYCLQGTALLMANLLPRHYVGMVVKLRHDNLVTWCKELTTIGLCHEVYALRGTTHKDNLLTCGSVDKVLNLLTSFLIGISSPCSQCVCASVDIAVIVLVIVADLIDHLYRLLRSSSIVEPYEVVAVHFLMQHGEILLDFLGVQGIHLLVVKLTEFLRFRNADAEAVVMRHSLHRTNRVIGITDIRKVGIAAATSQQLLEPRLQFLKVEDFVREYTLTNLPYLLGTIFLGELTQLCQCTVFLSLKSINFYHIKTFSKK